MHLPVAFLIFGTTVVMLEIAVIVFRGKAWGPLSTKLVGLTFVAVSAVFLALTAQLSAAYALLGVAAGYLAGRPDERP